MKKVLKEEIVLFISIFKWVILSTFVGIIVGLSTTVFLKILNITTKLTTSYPFYFLFLPVALFISSILVTYLAPDAEGHGTEKVIEAVHKYSGKIKPSVVLVKLIATVITIAGGGSVGKEGPSAQIGAGLSSIFANFLKLDNNDRRKLVICGISAGFSSVFGTPIAGAIFGVEVLYVGSILYEVLLPSFISGIVSFHVSSSLGITYFYHSINFVPVFNKFFIIKVILAGVFFGICSRLLIEIMNITEKFVERIHFGKQLKSLIGGVILIILTFIFSKQYLGLGTDTIQKVLEGEEVVWYAFIIKIIFTSITLNFGGSGGIVTPIFFIGATSGTLLAKLFNLDISTFSAIGLVSLLAGAANTPISASIIAIELFGTKLAPYASIACVVSFIMTGHKSVYPSQILAIKKSLSIETPIGKEIKDVAPDVKPRDKSLTKIILRIVKKIWKR